MPSEPVTTPLIPGYTPWSDPDLTGLTEITANGAAALNSLKTQFGNGTYKSSTHYIGMTGDARGYDFSGWNFGTADNPLVIMAAAPAGRRSWAGRPDLGGCKLTSTTTWLWLYQLKLSQPSPGGGNNGPAALYDDGNNCLVTRCLIDAPQGIKCQTTNNAWHGFNDFTGRCQDAKGDHNEAQHYLNFSKTTRPKGVWCYRNWFTQSGSFSGNENHVMYAGNGVSFGDNNLT
jgi:hypothetical protein